jgi:hypothetical protein
MTRVGRAVKRTGVAMTMNATTGGILVTTEEVGEQLAFIVREAVAASIGTNVVGDTPAVLAAIQTLTTLVTNSQATLAAQATALAAQATTLAAQATTLP